MKPATFVWKENCHEGEKGGVLQTFKRTLSKKGKKEKNLPGEENGSKLHTLQLQVPNPTELKAQNKTISSAICLRSTEDLLNTNSNGFFDLGTQKNYPQLSQTLEGE